MDIKVSRKVYTEKSTIGELSIDGAFECYTLEDMVRAGAKVPGKTAIPAGTYRVIIDMSARFGKLMPHVLDVPGFDGIRIHAGNTDADTEGCLILGRVKKRDRVEDSRAALVFFAAKLETAIQLGESVTLTIG